VETALARLCTMHIALSNMAEYKYIPTKVAKLLLAIDEMVLETIDDLVEDA
jgi:hypothetical protein